MADDGRRPKGLRLLAAPMLLLGGCGLPPAVVVAGYAADVGSFVATGKTTTDHGVSWAMDEDCALLRVLDEGRVCQPHVTYQYAGDGVLEPLPEGNLLPGARYLADGIARPRPGLAG